MNKKRTSRKVLSKDSLLERAINQQKELTEKMIGLTQEVSKANEIRRQARSIGPIVENLPKRPNVHDYLSEGGVNYGKMAEKSRMIDVINNPTAVSTHRESINKIEDLAVNMGRHQAVNESYQREIEELKSWKRSANEEATRLREGVDHYRLILEKERALSKSLAEKIGAVRKAVELKASYKQPHRRRVDARNINKLIAV